MRVLQAEDDVRLAEALQQAIERPHGPDAVLVLDWVLLGIQRVDLCRRLRALGAEVTGLRRPA